MLYLIGLGLIADITCESLRVIKKADEIYLEAYTMPWNYKEVKEKLEKLASIPVVPLEREKVESNFLVERAKEKDVVLLVGGDVFSATTHFTLYFDCLKTNIPVKTIHNSSIFSSISKTGLSIYKFGQTVTLSFWRENYKPTSPIHKIKTNYDNGMHTLVLMDIDKELGFMHAKEGISQLNEMQRIENTYFIKEVIVLSRLGYDDEKIIFGNVEQLLNKEKSFFGKPPFSLVVPSNPNPVEREFLSLFSKF